MPTASPQGSKTNALLSSQQFARPSLARPGARGCSLPKVFCRPCRYFALSKVRLSTITLQAAMDATRDGLKTPRMGKAPIKPRRREPARSRTLYLGQWLAVLGRKPSEVSRAVGCNEGYLSLLISGKQKRNPSAELILDLSDELGVSVNALYTPPPAQDVAGEVGKLSSRQWAAFLEVLAMRPNRTPQG